jgi:hypothetical protein
MQQNKSQFKRLMKLVELIRDTLYEIIKYILNLGLTIFVGRVESLPMPMVSGTYRGYVDVARCSFPYRLWNGSTTGGIPPCPN